MKPHSLITLILGVILVAFGITILVKNGSGAGAIPLLIGGALCYMGWRGGRTALLVLGHVCIVVGCFLITWGIYLLPNSQPTFPHILGRPLF